MAISTTFKSGNFNNVERWVKETIPSNFAAIRYTIIPRLDKSLIEMLGQDASIEKNTLDVSQMTDREGLHGFLCSLSYIVDDFNVPEASKEAIQEDEDKLRSALESEEIHLKDISINVNSGELKATFIIPVE